MVGKRAGKIEKSAKKWSEILGQKTAFLGFSET
jgi:hypothetical protein